MLVGFIKRASVVTFCGRVSIFGTRRANFVPMTTVEDVVTTKRSLSPSLLPKKTKKPKLRKYKAKKVDATSPLGVLQFEINDLLEEQELTLDLVKNDVSAILNDSSREGPVTQAYHREVDDVKVLKITSSGDGLGIIDNPVQPGKKQVVIIPFGLPGDTVKIRVFKTHPSYVESDLLEVTGKSEMRNDELINCKYFGKCSGCQFQFLKYESQLELKKKTIARAFSHFAPRLVSEGLLPEVGQTIGSPLQYGYRTKLTPHFDVPRKAKTLQTRAPLGFGQKGRPQWRTETLEQGGQASILDIEECPIGTTVVNMGMHNERERFAQEFGKYKKGATILLRENTTVIDATQQAEDESTREGSRDPAGQLSELKVRDDVNDKTLIKTCVTNTRQVVTEYIDGYTFQFSAGEFFQNNNSILPLVTKYVRENLQIANSQPGQEHNLVDAYCGSGLFSICSSKGVTRVIGVEISADSVSFAEHNAQANGVENCKFIVGKAEKLFESIDTPNDRTSVVLDPPRKGCDEPFLTQLADYCPAKIVYISCNVHSQARDVEFFLKNTDNGKRYKIESIRGFDFFPQTHHVEGVCVLSRVN